MREEREAHWALGESRVEVEHRKLQTPFLLDEFIFKKIPRWNYAIPLYLGMVLFHHI